MSLRVLEGAMSAAAGEALGEAIKFKLDSRFERMRERADEPDKTGKLWEVTIIESGVSLNGLDYAPEVLKEAAPLFAGVPIYAYKFGKAPGDEAKNHHLPDEAKAREPRGHVGNLVGRIVESWWDEGAQAIKGLMSVIDPPTREKLRDAAEAGEIGEGVDKPLLGLSIDADGLKEGAKVTKIVRPGSVDLVTKAAAGGSVDRLVASAEGNTEEIAMDINDIKGAVAEVMAGELAKLREQEPPEGAPSDAGADPISALRKMLESGDPGARKVLATRVLAMFKEMGLLQASAEDDRFQRMSADLKQLSESEDAPKTPKDWQAAITSLVESVIEEPKADPKTVRIEELETRLRESAISRELDSFMLADGRTFHDLPTAARLADLSGVVVTEDYSQVTGLKEALEGVATAKPWMLKEAAPADPANPAADGAANLTEGADGAAPAGEKPKPRGQSVRLTESDDGAESPSAKAIAAELAEVIPWAEGGDDRSITRMNILFGDLKRARGGV